MFEILNIDNMNFVFDKKADLIFCDPIYESLDFSWIDKYWDLLKDTGIFCVLTDFHSSAEIKMYLSTMPKAHFLNWLVWKNEFGNFRKDRFRQCHDDIIIFYKGDSYKFYPERVQVPKVTASSKGYNPSGRLTKLATSVITDICLNTGAKERVIKDDGHLIRWQKPVKLLDRIISPFVDSGEIVLDPFMGSGSLAEWCLENSMGYIGMELDKEVFNLANKRINNIKEGMR